MPSVHFFVMNNEYVGQQIILLLLIVIGALSNTTVKGIKMILKKCQRVENDYVRRSSSNDWAQQHNCSIEVSDE